MPMHPELRRSYIGRSRALEGSLRRLVNEIMEELPDEAQGELRYITSKIDVLFGDIEDLTAFEATGPTADRDRAIRETRREFDELMILRATIARRERDLKRKHEDLGLEEQKLHARQLDDELRAELGHGQGE